MAEENITTRTVDQFVLQQIDSVSHLEALLLVWNGRPKVWSIREMAQSLYVSTEVAGQILNDLARRGLVQEQDASSGHYECRLTSPELEKFMAHLDQTYRHELVRISKLIHSKAPSAVREFARAFRFTKEKK
ncbi:MAG: hypothetical protein K8T91_07970 [Planctomycetes bacterium]|nr:hypothetical protein [Planctomycetota bacterium]